jgi:stringent starvation protein B
MEKANVVTWLLKHNRIVGLNLNATVPGVVLPVDLMTHEQVVLEIGLDLPKPIHDLWIDGNGIAGTLSFDRPVHCLIPWAALRAAWGKDGRGTVWDDVPGPKQSAVAVLDGGAETTPPKRGHLRLC